MFRKSFLSMLSLTLLAQNAPSPTLTTPPSTSVADPGDPKEYGKVITSDAKTQSGFFKVHELKGKVYLEIPKELLGQQFGMHVSAAKVPSGIDHPGKTLYGGLVSFKLKGNKVYFEESSHGYVVDSDHPMSDAVEASQRDTVLMAFNVEAFSKDGSPVIEAGRLFANEAGSFSARGSLFNASSLDPSRSYVDRVRAFATNLRIDAVHTYVLSQDPASKTVNSYPARNASVTLAYNLIKLPEKPMMPRLLDDRVGFNALKRVHFTDAVNETKPEQLIQRWRLEKKHPEAALSEPIKPIIWYIDRATPPKWIPYVKKGVEAWNAAFEAAGFKNAVQARLFPTREEDPEFDPEDMRYSLIRWVPSPIQNAYGPKIADPRSGEIINANVVMYHDIMKLQRDWYISQAGASDPRVQKLPLPDDLMGDLIACIVTHECGHSIGFRHNHKSSSLYPVEKLRDPKWLKEMGHTPSIMDYCRYNYLVQPEDGVEPALLIPKIGPYDIFAVKWGYTPIPDAKTPEAERPSLNDWAKVQDTVPWLRFTSPKAELGDFGENIEAVGDADAVAATTLGLKNLQRIVKKLPSLAILPGEDDRALEELYMALWGQWTNELRHVANIVGGYESQNKHGDQPGAICKPIPKVKQAKALKFLNDHIFKTPFWIFESGVVERLSPLTPGIQLKNTQQRMIRVLLNQERCSRLQAHEVALGSNAYRMSDLLTDLRQGIFTELFNGSAIEPYRRNLQRIYIEQLHQRLNAPAIEPSARSMHNTYYPVFNPFGNPADDARSLVRNELKQIKALFSKRIAAVTDHTQKAHFEDMVDLASRSLDPKVPLNVPAPSVPFRND